MTERREDALLPEAQAAPAAHVDAIDGLRALAVCAVILFHLDPGLLPGGFVGVDVFFVISGYVVTASLLRHTQRPWGAFVLEFYARRFRRIVPALVVCLCLTVLASVALIPQAWLSSTMQTVGLHAFFGLSNLALISQGDGYFAPRAELNVFTHTWSLAVEEQFYVLFPPLLYACARAQGRARAGWHLGLLLLCAMSLAWCAWATTQSASKAYYGLPSRCWELGAGVGVALLGASGRARWASAVGSGRLAWAGAGLVLGSMALAQKTLFPFPWAVPAVLGSTALVLALTAGRSNSPVAALLRAGPVVAVGLRSYSLYLWHWPIFTLLRWTVGLGDGPTMAAALVLTAACAQLSYRWVETPLLRGARSTHMPAWGSVALGLTMVVGGWQTAQFTYAHTTSIAQSRVSRERVAWYPDPLAAARPGLGSAPGCRVDIVHHRQAEPPHSTFEPADCPPALVPARARLFVVGDSHVGAYSRLLQLTAAATGMQVTTYSRGGCSMLGLMQPVRDIDAVCATLQSKVLAAIIAHARPGDIVWAASLRVPRLADHWGAYPAQQVHASLHGVGALKARAAAEAEAVDILRRLSAAGLRTVIDAPKPVFRAAAYRCVDAYNRMNPVCDAGLDIPRDLALAHRQSTLDAMQRLAATSAALSIWDPLPALCEAQVCRALDAAGPLFFDLDHLSGHGNERLLASWLTFLDRQLGVASVAVPLAPS